MLAQHVDGRVRARIRYKPERVTLRLEGAQRIGHPRKQVGALGRLFGVLDLGLFNHDGIAKVKKKGEQVKWHQVTCAEHSNTRACTGRLFFPVISNKPVRRISSDELPAMT